MKNAARTQAINALRRTAAPDYEPDNNAAYEEYLRGFDEIPVLQDAVRIPPPRPPQPDFRRGERRNAREVQRPDAYSAREATMAEMALLYREYAQPVQTAAPEPRKKRASKRKTAARGRTKVASKKKSRKH